MENGTIAYLIERAVDEARSQQFTPKQRDYRPPSNRGEPPK